MVQEAGKHIPVKLGILRVGATIEVSGRDGSASQESSSIIDQKAPEVVMQATSSAIGILRKQSGFREELTLVNKDGTLGISIWDDRKSADSYQTSAYPQVLAKLNHVIDGTPKVETYEVSATTLHLTPAMPLKKVVGA